MKCKFCNLTKEDKIIFKTEHFIFFHSKFPVLLGHCLLITKEHYRRENKIPDSYLKEYKDINEKAYLYIRSKYKHEPLVYINPPHQQSIRHFHKHFLPGIFGILGVENALKNFISSKN